MESQLTFSCIIGLVLEVTNFPGKLNNVTINKRHREKKQLMSKEEKQLNIICKLLILDPLVLYTVESTYKTLYR